MALTQGRRRFLKQNTAVSACRAVLKPAFVDSGQDHSSSRSSSFVGHWHSSVRIPVNFPATVGS
jgi:hypothetical protein